MFFPLYNTDTVNGISFHPFLPMVASSSGHRRFIEPDDDGNEDLHLSGNSIDLKQHTSFVFCFCFLNLSFPKNDWLIDASLFAVM